MNFVLLRKSVLSLFLIVIISAVYTSCRKDSFDFNKMAQSEWNPNLAIPLIHSSFTIEDLLSKANDSLISIGSDKSITLVYRGELLSLKAEDVFIIPNQDLNNTLALPAGDLAAFALLPMGSSYPISWSDTLDFDPGNGTRMDSMILKTGTLALTFSSFLQQDVQIKMDVPRVKQNGVSFSKTFSLNYNGTTLPVSSNSSFDFSGYNLSAVPNNKLEVKYTVTITKTSNNLNASDQISVNETFTNLTFKKFYGYLGQMSLSPYKDTIDFNLFSASSGFGSFTLADATLKVGIENSYGVPLQCSFAKLRAVPASGSTPVDIGGVGLPNPLPINSPSISQMGQLLTSSFSLTGSNSNLVVALNSKPKYVVYDVSSMTNPGGNTSQNFVLDTSLFKLNMDFEIPLYGKINNFVLQDTLDFKFGTVDKIESLTIRSFITNEFPVDVKVQAYFTDSLFNVKDSLSNDPSQIILPSGIVSSTTNRVTSSSSKTTDFVLSKAKINKLGDVRKIIIVGRLSSFNNGATDVKFYSDYNLDVSLAAQVQAKTTISFNSKK